MPAHSARAKSRTAELRCLVKNNQLAPSLTRLDYNDDELVNLSICVDSALDMLILFQKANPPRYSKTLPSQRTDGDINALFRSIEYGQLLFSENVYSRLG